MHTQRNCTTYTRTRQRHTCTHTHTHTHTHNHTSTDTNQTQTHTLSCDGIHSDLTISNWKNQPLYQQNNHLPRATLFVQRPWWCNLNCFLIFPIFMERSTHLMHPVVVVGFFCSPTTSIGFSLEPFSQSSSCWLKYRVDTLWAWRANEAQEQPSICCLSLHTGYFTLCFFSGGLLLCFTLCLTLWCNTKKQWTLLLRKLSSKLIFGQVTFCNLPKCFENK